MELIEDDRLEMMELAAAKKGLPSIVSLDHETLQNLESFRGNVTSCIPMRITILIYQSCISKFPFCYHFMHLCNQFLLIHHLVLISKKFKVKENRIWNFVFNVYLVFSWIG